MGSPSFASSTAAFCLPPSTLSTSFPRRSYAAAVSSTENPSALTRSLTSLSVQPTPPVQHTPLSSSNTRSRVISVMSTHETYVCCGLFLKDMHALYEHDEDAHFPNRLEHTGLSSIPRSTCLGSSHSSNSDAGLDPALTRAVAGEMDRYSTTGSIAPRSINPALIHASSSASSGYPAITPSRTDSNGTSRIANGGARSRTSVTVQPSLFTKPQRLRCPNPDCNKVYKQSSGLKYHQLSGFANVLEERLS